MAAKATELEVPGGPGASRLVRVSSPDRLIWPDDGITKLDLAPGERGHRRVLAVLTFLRGE